MGSVDRLGVSQLRDTVRSFRDALRVHAAELDRLNVYPVPDGDTGTNMAQTLEAVVAEVERSDPDLGATCQAISHGSLMGARGNSGVILSQLLRGMTAVFERVGDLDAGTVADALRAGATAAYAAVLRPVEGTILTVAREAADGAERAAAAGSSVVEVLDRARAAGHQALERTPELLPVLRDAGVVDAGGAGYLLLLEAALHAIDGRPLPEPPGGPARAPIGPAVARPHAGGPRYEVMYFLHLPDDRIDAFKQAWGTLGDSIVVVGGDGLWNCHVHADDIGAAVEAALDVGGRPARIRVTDLHEQEVPVEPGPPVGVGQPVAMTAVVAVAAGRGLTALFRQLGASATVEGGQSANPSTADLLAAVDGVAADEVVLLPNNRNIVAVARQVPALTPKRVEIVPTTSVPAGLSAMVSFQPDRGAADNASTMGAAAGEVAVGELTRAVRAASSGVGPVRAGDAIGLVPGRGIVAVAADLEVAALALLAHLLEAGGELVTIVEGDGAPTETTEAIRAWLRRQHPDVEVEVHRGDQPLYPYLFGVE